MKRLFIIRVYYGSEVCNVGMQRNKKNNSFYFKFILINIKVVRRFSV